MKLYSTLFLVFLSLFALAQSDSTKKQVVLTRITMDINDIQDALLFASSIDISLKPTKQNEKYATHILLGSMELGDVRTVQMDLIDKKIDKTAITSNYITKHLNPVLNRVAAEKNVQYALVKEIESQGVTISPGIQRYNLFNKTFVSVKEKH